MRFALSKAQHKFDDRTDLLTNVIRKVRFFVIGTAISRGDLPFTEDWWKVRYQAPAKITVDVGREAQQNREDLRYGNRTLAEDAGERGVDWEEMGDQRKVETKKLFMDADELSRETGKPFELCLAYLRQNTPNGNMAAPPQKNEGTETETGSPTNNQ
jgi:hypothetical protein